MKTLKFSLAIMVLFYLTNCRKDKGALVQSAESISSNCDTLMSISYSLQIVPIINTNCNSCHGTGSMPDLSTYNAVKAAAATNLYSSVSWDGTTTPMPQGATSKIPFCDIRKIKKWIDQGSRNN